ncbi:MAG: hypothetical protein GYA18_06870 [Chloroflexi bacterium]|nr:hypothetical protein [Chloroflexota bacterium]
MKKIVAIVLIAPTLVGACSSTISTNKGITPTSTPFPNETPTQTLVLLPLLTEDPELIAYNFQEHVCDATWSNNGETLPCPGNAGDISSGAIFQQEEVIISGNILVQNPALVTIPAQNDSRFFAIFGKYPAFTVQQGDVFKATLACLNEKEKCDVQFALEYIDEAGNYGTLTQAIWNETYDSAGHYTYAQVDLSFLAGKTVQFVLALRDNNDSSDDWAVWIQPIIWRDPDFSSSLLTPYAQEHLSIIDEAENIPGVISGKVDMSDAPPYLAESGLPVAVVMFNNTDLTYWWVHTNTSDQSFQMTVTPGEYQIIAYGIGVGDETYVSAAYTGQVPSCGNEPANISIRSNQHVDGIIINDWNWLCGRNAKHPGIPANVPIPE